MRWPQLEDKIEQWVIEQRTAGRSVSTVSIRLKATAVARDMNINDFRGGPSWCFLFMKRHNLSIRTRTIISQQLPKDYEEKLAIFRTYCKNKITEKKIRPEHITNMDEIPLTFLMFKDQDLVIVSNKHDKYSIIHRLHNDVMVLIDTIIRKQTVL